MKFFFCANLLRHWPEFSRVVESEPRGTFIDRNISKHPFVHQIEKARAAAHISKSDFDKWVEEINKGFIQNNINCVPLKLCAHIPGLVVDSRNFVQIIRGMNNHMHNMAVLFHDMNKELKQQRSINLENHSMLLNLPVVVHMQTKCNQLPKRL